MKRILIVGCATLLFACVSAKPASALDLHLGCGVDISYNRCACPRLQIHFVKYRGSCGADCGGMVDGAMPGCCGLDATGMQSPEPPRASQPAQTAQYRPVPYNYYYPMQNVGYYPMQNIGYYPMQNVGYYPNAGYYPAQNVRPAAYYYPAQGYGNYYQAPAYWYGR